MTKIRKYAIIWSILQLILLALVIHNSSEMNYNSALIIVMISLLGNVVISFINRRQQIIVLFFYMMMFLFLIGRPFIALIRGVNWWDVASSEAIMKSLISIELVLVLIPIGALLIKDFNIEQKYLKITSNIDNINKLRNAALVILIFGLLGSIVDGVQKIQYMSSHTYIEYYVDYSSNLPLILKGFIRMLKPSLILYLAAFPKKKPAFIVLGAFVLTTIPNMIIGMRSPTMLALLFGFTYFCMREYLYPNKEKWIGKIMIVALAIAVPILIIFAYSYNFIRTGRDYTIDTEVFLNFIYQQGNSFDVLARGFDVLDILPLKGWPGYMLGPSYDNIVYGSVIGRTIFGTPVLGTQSIDMLTLGHDMKQHLSYTLIGDDYFLGHGTGAVFILEVIHDIGWVGLALYSIVVGWFCVKVMDQFISSKLIVSTLFLYSILQIYYVPRSDALVFLEQTVNPYFWITILLIVFLSKVSQKESFKRLKNKMFLLFKFGGN